MATEQREVLVYGEEAENGVTVFRCVLSFSRELAKETEHFARMLCESETFPRMMEELAEEYFADLLPR